MLQSLKKKLLIFFGLLFIISAYVWLYTAWYKNQAVYSFHFFDDSEEWLGLDKLGHFTTAFFESWIGFELSKIYVQSPYRQGSPGAHLSPLIYCWWGFFLQLPVELMDGFSIGYGFSMYDCLANFLGCMAVIVQYVWWNEVRIMPKIFFYPSPYASFRPNLLGNNIFEQFIKDYNGQTYWLTFNPNQLFKIRIFPDWLNLAIGYGGSGLLGGHDNEWIDEFGAMTDKSHVQRLSRFYLSLDLNIDAISIQNRYLKAILRIFNLIKIPVPAIECNSQAWFLFHFFLIR